MNKQKTAFFDMDGTIVAPVFQYEGRTVTGLPKDQWIALCEQQRESTYKNCPVVQPTLKYALDLTHNGWETKILTIALSKGEELAKRQWLSENYRQRRFHEIVFVKTPDEKIEYILEYAKSNGLNPDDCLLVEDDLNTIFKANTAGIKTMHLSHVISAVYDAAKE